MTTPRATARLATALAAFGVLFLSACGTAGDAGTDDATCLAGATECADDPSDTDDEGAVDTEADGSADSACLVGATDCGDDPSSDAGESTGEEAPPSMTMCAPDVPECDDMVVEEDTTGDDS